MIFKNPRGFSPGIFVIVENGVPERIWTSDLSLRRAALYPAELRVRILFNFFTIKLNARGKLTDKLVFGNLKIYIFT